METMQQQYCKADADSANCVESQKATEQALAENGLTALAFEGPEFIPNKIVHQGGFCCTEFSNGDV
jgi:hypothetical protein